MELEDRAAGVLGSGDDRSGSLDLEVRSVPRIGETWELAARADDPEPWIYLIVGERDDVRWFDLLLLDSAGDPLHRDGEIARSCLDPARRGPVRRRLGGDP